VALFGVITFGGKVFRFGGVMVNVVAARRARVSTIILPLQNRRDLDEVPKEPFKDIRFVFVDNMRQVFREALKEKVPPPISSSPRPQRMPQAAAARPI
jgi:ATP-dependent Lon protease